MATKRILKIDIAAKIKLEKENITEELNKIIKLQFEDYKKQIASANGKITLTQGKLDLEKGYYEAAFINFITTSYSCIECEDYQNIQLALNFILNDCLQHLSLEEISNLKIIKDIDIDLLLTKLKEFDSKHVLTSKIQEIQIKITTIPKLSKDKPQEQPKA